jgi:hypothetical protein
LEAHRDLAEEYEPLLKNADALVAAFEATASTSPEDAVGLDGLQRSNPEGYQEVLLTILPKELGWES